MLKMMNFVFKMMNLSGKHKAHTCGVRSVRAFTLLRISIEMAAFSIENSTENAAILNRHIQHLLVVSFLYFTLAATSLLFSLFSLLFCAVFAAVFIVFAAVFAAVFGTRA